jgi:hypothetical protein
VFSIKKRKKEEERRRRNKRRRRRRRRRRSRQEIKIRLLCSEKNAKQILQHCNM